MPRAITYTHTFAGMGETSTPILAENSDRKYAFVQNFSDQDVFLKVGVNAALNEGFLLTALGGWFEMGEAFSNLNQLAINGCVANGTNKRVSVMEGT